MLFSDHLTESVDIQCVQFSVIYTCVRTTTADNTLMYVCHVDGAQAVLYWCDKRATMAGVGDHV